MSDSSELKAMLAEATVLTSARNVDVSGLLRDAVRLAGVRKAMRCGAGADALSAIAEHDPDCLVVLIDAQTPALVQTIRSEARAYNPYLPIIGILSAPSAKDIREAIRIGLHEVLALPFKGGDLASRIARTIFMGRPFVTAGGYFGPCRRRMRDPAYLGKDRRAEDADEAWGVRASNEKRARDFVAGLG